MVTLDPVTVLNLNWFSPKTQVNKVDLSKKCVLRSCCQYRDFLDVFNGFVYQW